MDAKRCDCCGKYYSKHVEFRFSMVPRSFNLTMKLDFCDECQKKLDAFPAYYISVKDGKKEETNE